MKHHLNEGPTDIRKVKKYGTRVWREPVMDVLRTSHCMCLRCGKLGKCPTATKLYKLCVKTNIAVAITRCPDWEPNAKSKE